MTNASTKPAGATSYKQTAFGVISRDELIKLELEGTKRGLEYIYQLIKNDDQAKLTSELILELHQISFGWIFPEWAGKYRTIQVTYSGKEAPSYFLISELVTNLCNDLNERWQHLPKFTEDTFTNAVIPLLSWFQHRYVVIHPFQDYNGRTARMLTTLLLLNLRLPPAEIKADSETDRQAYLKALQAADEGNFSLLESLIENSIRESMLKAAISAREYP